MSHDFRGAEPKILNNKPKYNNENTDPNQDDNITLKPVFNIMYDKRVFRGNTHGMEVLKEHLTPAQRDDLRFKAEREKKKVEMIKAKLIDFKKAKNKISPYELRPGPPARIEVDLTYFLTEQGKEKPEQVEIRVQTDEFQIRPPTPLYRPMKTGIDKITQIEDYDLFDYEREVQPIINVLLTKTVEQALLEVEEETEIEEIKKFKDGCYQRNHEERNGWA